MERRDKRVKELAVSDFSCVPCAFAPSELSQTLLRCLRRSGQRNAPMHVPVRPALRDEDDQIGQASPLRPNVSMAEQE